MPKIVPAVAIGLLLGQVVALLLWWWGFYLHPPSPVIDLNPALARAEPGRISFAPLLWQALGQGAGAALGGWQAMRLSREGPRAAWIVGGLSLLMAIVWMITFPRPLWFPLFSLIFIGGGAYAAGRYGPEAPRRRARA